MNRTDEIMQFYKELLEDQGEEGDIGFCSFKSVYNELIPVQQGKLEEICGERFLGFQNSGSFVSIAIAYRNPVIDYINKKENDGPDYILWNEYAKEYNRLNQILNSMSMSIAERFDGIPLTATIGGMDDVGINHVQDYFPMVVSHRVVAENAGLGWRGKNQLTIHETYSCALRFASIIVPVPLNHGSRMESKCGDCYACEEVCTFIKNREILPDYRENCRRYILFLKSKGIEKDICGKCIKACYREGVFSNQFQLSESIP